MKRRPLAALEHRPWIVALVAAVGVTLLVPSAAALLLPTDLLDAAIALGEARLKMALAALFVLTAAFSRLLLRRRDPAEEDEELAPPVSLADREAPARSYLR